MRKRRSILLLLSLSLMLLLTACGGNSEENNSNSIVAGSDDKLVIGLECGYAPFNWTQMNDSNGGVPILGDSEYAGGYDVEMAKLIAEKLGKELVVVKTEWNGLVPSLESGKIDVIMAGMSPTEERKQSIDFSDNYYKSDLVMVVKADGDYINASSIQDFSGAKLTGQLNTFHYSVIDQIDGVVKETAMEDFPAMRVALESGIIDGYVSERPEGVSASSANPNFKMIEFSDGFETDDDDTAIAVGIKKNSPLKDEINKILSQISEEDRVEIMDRAIENQPSAN